MKIFGIILITGYFLAREKESSTQPRMSLQALLHEWAIYLLCTGLPFFTGIFLAQPAATFNPLILLLAAALPAIVFKGRPICMLAGAFTAFVVLHFLPDMGRAVMVLAWMEGAILVTAFLCLGVRARMANLYLPALTQKTPGRMLILFATALLLALVYQKAIQLF